MIGSGAGASARQSTGITACSGMIASACLAGLFVPSFCGVVQRLDEWLKGRKTPKPAPLEVTP